MEFTAKQLAEILHGSVDGNPEAIATSFAKIEHGKTGNLCFFANPKYEEYVYTRKPSILLVNNDFEPKKEVSATMVRVENAYTAVAELLNYVSSLRKKYRRHRGFLCHIAFTAKIGKRVSIGDYTHIGPHCAIGDNSIIGDNVSIGKNTSIGKNCIIYSGVQIYPGMKIGDNVILHSNAVIGSDGFGNAPQPDGSWKKIEHLGNVIIGNNVEIGACTTVDRAEMESTIIGNGVKIDNLCQIAHNVEIGDNTVMAAQTGIAGSAKIGKNCIFAGQVGIVGHITIADNTTVAAKSSVTNHVKKPGQIILGNPGFDSYQFKRSYIRFKQLGKE